MDISVLGVDLGKNVCSVVGLDSSGAVVMCRKVRRETLIALAEKLPPCIVGMEACCGAHHLGRVFVAHGHDVRLMSPEYVRPYIKAQKNDDRDAEGIAWLGLVPRQFTTGGKPKLLGISKRGNKYLRKQLIHGARAALPYIAERDTPLGRWVKGLMSRTHRNVVVVALANKLARIACAVLQRGKPFDAGAVSVAAYNSFGRSEAPVVQARFAKTARIEEPAVLVLF